MRVAGVRLGGHGMLWVDAGEIAVSCLDEVTVRRPAGDAVGRVYIVPEQWVRPPLNVDGIIVERLVHIPVDPDDSLPGSDLPPLGTRARVGNLDGWIVGIDPVAHCVTVAGDAGNPLTVPLTEITRRQQDAVIPASDQPFSAARARPEGRANAPPSDDD